MKTWIQLGALVFLGLTPYSSAFAGGGGGCSGIPVLLKNKTLVCAGKYRPKAFLKLSTRINVTYTFDDPSVFDNSNSGFTLDLVHNRTYDTEFSLAFGCDDTDALGRVHRPGKVHASLNLGADFKSIDLMPGTNSFDVQLEDTQATGAVRCELQ